MFLDIENYGHRRKKTSLGESRAYDPIRESRQDSWWDSLANLSETRFFLRGQIGLDSANYQAIDSNA